jgi:hypothetical protein
MRAAATTCSRSLGMSIGVILLACTPAAIRAAPADQQPITSTPAPTTGSASAKADHLPQITIEANRPALEKRVQAFVGQLTHSSRFSAESVPRWVEPLCFEVAGVLRNYAEFVVARLSRVASTVGAPLRKAGCSRTSANFYVLFSRSPSESLNYLHRHPSLLFHWENGPQQYDRFLNPPNSEVVRVWHNAEFLDYDGAPAGTGCAGVSGASCGIDSRIRLSAVQSFMRTLVVIDSTRIAGIQIGQISDYIAMVGLVDVDPDASFGDAPSILRLFTDPSNKRPEGLTEWDRAFLRALYGTDQRNTQQRGQIVTKMVDEIAH